MSIFVQVSHYGHHLRTTVDTKTQLTIMDDGKKAWLSNGSASSPTDNESLDILSVSKSVPKFEQKLANCLLVDGSDITFSCKVTGMPLPNVSALGISSDISFASYVCSFGKWKQLVKICCMH